MTGAPALESGTVAAGSQGALTLAIDEQGDQPVTDHLGKPKRGVSKAATQTLRAGMKTSKAFSALPAGLSAIYHR